MFQKLGLLPLSGETIQSITVFNILISGNNTMLKYNGVDANTHVLKAAK